MKQGDWYVDVDMNHGAVRLPWFTALGCFWPGLQVLYGDVAAAERTLHTFHNIWRQLGFVPEILDLRSNKILPNHAAYFLRPELIESTMYQARATGDPIWLHSASEFIESIEEVSWVCWSWKNMPSGLPCSIFFTHPSTHHLRPPADMPLSRTSR